MKAVLRWLPIWLLSSVCVTVGFMNGRSFANLPEPEPGESYRWDAQAGWYALGMLVFWAQLIVWAFCNPTRSYGWHIGLAVAFFASIGALVLGIALGIREPMFDF